MYLKNVFIQQFGKTSSVFSLSAIFLSSSVLLFFFFFLKRVCKIILLYFWTVFWNSLLVLFLPSLFSRKNQLQKFIFVFFSLFLFHFFSFNIFFSFITFLFHNFSFPLFCSSLCAFSSFFSSLLLHSFFFSPSQCFSFTFFFSTPCFLICFSPSPFLSILFLFWNILLFSFWSWSLCFLTSLQFFLHLRLCFLAQTNSKFSVVNFSMTKMSVFSNPPVIWIFSRVFSSLRRHFSFFVQCFLFFRDSSLLLILIFFYHSSLWSSSKNRFDFEKSKESLILFSILFFLKNRFPDFLNTFRHKTTPPCIIFKKHFANCLCFQTLSFFGKNVFFIPLFLFKKKTPQKSNWFSLLFLFTSASCFVLSLCVFSLCLLSSLLLFLFENNFRERKSWKMFSPTFTFFTILLWRAEKKSCWASAQSIYVQMSLIWSASVASSRLPFLTKKKEDKRKQAE